MLINRKTIVMALALALSLLAPRVAAQGESAIIQATATVITSLAITGTHDLQFGVVVPSMNKTVTKTTVGEAGEWNVTGTVNAELQLTFTLPDSLTHETQAVGMNVLFNATDASYDDGSGGGQTLPVATINPNSASTERLGATGAMTIWIGGTVIPRLSQTGGNYAADITLTVAYTGS